MIKQLTTGLLLIWALTGCNDYFEYENQALLKDELVFSDYNYIKQVLTNAYTQLPPSFNRIDNGMLESATDDAEHAWDYSRIQLFNSGNWDAFNNPDDVWTRQYLSIRRAYVFLNGTDTTSFNQFRYVDDNTYNRYHADLKVFRAEAKFLIAFFYFELFKRYGGVPIIDRVLKIDEELNLPKNSVPEVVSFIVKNCDEAAALLPKVHDSNNTGRATQGAALALKARTLLYAASPLFNNGQYDKATADLAAKTAAEFLTGSLKASYSLQSNYGALFIRNWTSPELIFERREGNSNYFEKANFPIGFDGSGVGATCPSQNLVDAYEMLNGKPISDPTSGYDPANPYKNRDPRLESTIIVNNAGFSGRTIQLWTGGRDGKGKEKASKTGYYLRKYQDDQLDLLQNRTSRHTWYYFRLGEMYLNFAEAANEAHGPLDNRYGLTALEAVNVVRKRAGMPALNAADYNGASALREKIRNERRIELAFEDHRSWDVKRWQIAETTLGADLKGMDITRNSDGSFNYSPYIVEKRIFAPKMYFYPIPNSEIMKQPKLVQNPGWF